MKNSSQKCRGHCLAIDPHVDAAAILARYWNDRLPESVNFERISWWLSRSDPSARQKAGTTRRRSIR
jgi:hypothetical protein